LPAKERELIRGPVHLNTPQRRYGLASASQFGYWDCPEDVATVAAHRTTSEIKIMGRFDSRNSRKMLRRRAQSAKKKRLKNRAKAVHESRAAVATPKKRSSKAASTS
jgi:hypothetical protein